MSDTSTPAPGHDDPTGYDPTRNIPEGSSTGGTPVETGEPSDLATGTGKVLAMRFREPLMAQEALLAALRLRAKGHLGLEDAAIVGKDTNGKVRIQQTKDLNAIQGASSGLWLGVLAGLFVPGGVLIGGALGAAVGGLWAKLRDIGISDQRMKELGDELPEGQVALFMLLTDAHRYHAMAELRRFPANLFYSTLSDADVTQVNAALAEGVIDEGY